MPLKPTLLNKVDWLPLLDRFERYLACWKGPCLSRGGRLVLVNSVLYSIPLNYMSYFILPNWVIDHIDKIRRAFLWKGSNEVKGGLCLINWAQVCRPKSQGGPGVRNLCLANISLITKWWWRLLSSSDIKPPWAILVNHNYYQHRRLWDLSSIPPTACSPFWRGVLRCTNYFKLGIGFSFRGQGHSIKFWTDHWIGDQTLASAFPSLFEVATNPSATVHSQIRHGLWALTFNYILTPLRFLSLQTLLHFRCWILKILRIYLPGYSTTIRPLHPVHCTILFCHLRLSILLLLTFGLLTLLIRASAMGMWVRGM